MPKAKPKKPNKSVELLDAFMWLCPECGKKNFAQAVTIEMSDKDKKEIFSLEPWEDTPPGDFLSMPNVVSCVGCKEKFSTKDPYDYDEGADDAE